MLAKVKYTHFPPAKMLLAFLLSNVTAVTGPGRSLLLPTAVHVELSIANIATFDAVPSESAMDPDAKSSS